MDVSNEAGEDLASSVVGLWSNIVYDMLSKVRVKSRCFVWHPEYCLARWGREGVFESPSDLWGGIKVYLHKEFIGIRANTSTFEGVYDKEMEGTEVLILLPN